MEGRRTLSLAAVVIALQVVMATASQNVTSEEVISRQKRFIYIPLTDVFSYNQIVTIGFALLLTVIVAALAYLSEDASGYEASTGYLTPHRRVIDRNGMLSEWSDDWYKWVPVLDNLMGAMDKYQGLYQSALDVGHE
ncbi:uncharacterized protein LOC125043551 isoform X1 [Penaeus chinensis]|uniref:uncharacterized protein LOC125043551 isoform X1 n=1 Tax=Penaeus chinensis TaxID=139456 RepID=UPI001FB7E004|nr:uncharacterized protein LOC125043551 isoform X1 [Penaeus chinensis]XP_047495687.1 uncharacterized protein LOC125043551 isoform X1 [Penaeus chinensis]